MTDLIICRTTIYSYSISVKLVSCTSIFIQYSKASWRNTIIFELIIQSLVLCQLLIHVFMFSFGLILSSAMVFVGLNGQEFSSAQCNCDEDNVSTLIDIQCRLKQLFDKCVVVDISSEKGI